jgi:hypothetical protein
MHYPEATVVLYNFRSRKFIETWKVPDWDQIARDYEAGRSASKGSVALV